MNRENAIKEFLLLFLTYGGYAGRYLGLEIRNTRRHFGLDVMDDDRATQALRGDFSLKTDSAWSQDIEFYGLTHVLDEEPELLGLNDDDWDGKRTMLIHLEELNRYQLIELWVEVYTKKLMNKGRLNYFFAGNQEWPQGEWEFYISNYDIKKQVESYIQNLQKFEDG